MAGSRGSLYRRIGGQAISAVRRHMRRRARIRDLRLFKLSNLRNKVDPGWDGRVVGQASWWRWPCYAHSLAAWKAQSLWANILFLPFKVVHEQDIWLDILTQTCLWSRYCAGQEQTGPAPQALSAGWGRCVYHIHTNKCNTHTRIGPHVCERAMCVCAWIYLYVYLHIIHTNTQTNLYYVVDEGMVTEEKREKKKSILGTQSKARAGWPKRLRLVQATPWADFAVITAQLWSTMTAIFSCVNFFAFNCYLRPRF